jgi:hypothetical protein
MGYDLQTSCQNAIISTSKPFDQSNSLIVTEFKHLKTHLGRLGSIILRPSRQTSYWLDAWCYSHIIEILTFRSVVLHLFTITTQISWLVKLVTLCPQPPHKFKLKNFMNKTQIKINLKCSYIEQNTKNVTMTLTCSLLKSKYFTT